MKHTIQYKCPYCDGCGVRTQTVEIKPVNEKAILAKEMRNQGATLQEIATALKVKSISTADYYLKKQITK